MLYTVLITVFIYSLILTIVTLYKDSSGYYMADDIDILTAGPGMLGVGSYHHVS